MQFHLVIMVLGLLLLIYMVLKTVGVTSMISCCIMMLFLYKSIGLLSCELHLFQSINNDFVAFAKSSMDDKIADGILYGRPFGGLLS
jgi:hypothetical protein